MQLIDKNKIISLLSLKLQWMSDQDKKRLSEGLDRAGLTGGIKETTDTQDDKIDYLIDVCKLFGVSKQDLVDDGILYDNQLNENWKNTWLDRL